MGLNKIVIKVCYSVLCIFVLLSREIIYTYLIFLAKLIFINVKTNHTTDITTYKSVNLHLNDRGVLTDARKSGTLVQPSCEILIFS